MDPEPARRGEFRDAGAGLSSIADLLSTAVSWDELPTSVLLAELERRQEDLTKPACGSAGKGSYNTSAHVLALVLILFLSTICQYSILPSPLGYHLKTYQLADFL